MYPAWGSLNRSCPGVSCSNMLFVCSIGKTLRATKPSSSRYAQTLKRNQSGPADEGLWTTAPRSPRREPRSSSFGPYHHAPRRYTSPNTNEGGVVPTYEFSYERCGPFDGLLPFGERAKRLAVWAAAPPPPTASTPSRVSSPSPARRRRCAASTTSGARNPKWRDAPREDPARQRRPGRFGAGGPGG